MFYRIKILVIWLSGYVCWRCWIYDWPKRYGWVWYRSWKSYIFLRINSPVIDYGNGSAHYISDSGGIYKSWDGTNSCRIAFAPRKNLSFALRTSTTTTTMRIVWVRMDTSATSTMWVGFPAGGVYSPDSFMYYNYTSFYVMEDGSMITHSIEYSYGKINYSYLNLVRALKIWQNKLTADYCLQWVSGV